MKNRIILILVFVLLFSFNSKVLASELCSSNGYSIFTINGVNTNESGAIDNKNEIKRKFSSTYNNQPLKVDYLYNPTHLDGVGDILDTVAQGVFNEKSDYDLTEILKDASEKIDTQKVLLVAHSQGNFYANNFYDKVANQPGGIPSESIGVYGVASPASRVAGGGKYITSDTDKVINKVAGLVMNTLKPNVHIDLQDGDDPLGHNFTDVYMKYQSDRIVAEIKSSLDKLQNNDEQDPNSPCLSAPEITLGHKIEGTLLASADTILDYVKNSNKDVINSLAYILKGDFYVANLLWNSLHNTGLAFKNIVTHLPANVIQSLPDQNNLTQNSLNNSEQNVDKLVVKKEINIIKNPEINSQNDLNDTDPDGIDPLAYNPTTPNFFNSPVLHISSGVKKIIKNNNIPETPPPHLPTYITENITKDTVWNLAGSPYIIQNRITIDAGATLTVDPGVEVKFAGDFGLLVFGALNAQGKDDQKINFTNLSDLDGSSWGGISFINAGDSFIANANLKHIDNLFFLLNSKLEMKNVQINGGEDGIERGIELNNSILNADNINCTNMKDSFLIGYNNSIMDLKNSKIAYQKNEDINNFNKDDAIDIYSSSTLNISNTSLSLDGNSPLLVYNDSSVNADNLTVSSLNNSYDNDIEIYDNSNFNLNNSSISYSGIETFSNSNSKITDSSVTNVGSDDDILLVFSDSTVSVDNTKISYNNSIPDYDMGYGSPIAVFSGGNLTLNNSSIQGSNSTFDFIISTFDSSDLDPSVINIDKTVFDGGADSGINLLVNENVFVHNSIFKNFSNSAIENDGTSTIDAKNNFWSDASGPYNLSQNADALGEAISDNVSFSPWCIDETCSSFDSLPIIVPPVDPDPDPNPNPDPSPVLSSEKVITAFNFMGLVPEVDGVIDENDHTISATVPFGADVSALVPTISISDKASILPENNLVQDFTNPVTYTVKAEDGSTQDYLVTVTIAPDPNPTPPPPVVTLPVVTSYTLNGATSDLTVNPSKTNVSLVFNSNESVNWMSIKIEDQNDTTVYKNLQSDKSGCVDGTSICTKNWDGSVSPKDKTLQTGTYKIKVHMKDSANNEFQDYVLPYVINVDTSL